MELTPPSLLDQIRTSPSKEAWQRLVSLYAPLLHHWAMRAGCGRDDADDLVQEVFLVLVHKLPDFEYDPRRTFRGWLRTVTINKWREKQRQKAPRAMTWGDDPTFDPAEDFWEKDYRTFLVRRALDLMKTDFPDTWQACSEIIMEGRKVAEVAAERGMTANALYQAKFRILTRLRQELANMVD